MYGWRSRIGLISSINENVERSFYANAPEGVSYTNARVSAIVEKTPEAAAKLADEIVAEAAKYKGVPVEVLVSAPMMGSYACGMEWDKALAARMEEVSGVPALTYGMAVLDALKALGIKKLAIATPYGHEGNDAERKFFEDNGIEVTQITNMDFSYVCRYGRVMESTDGYQMYGNFKKMFNAGLNGAEALYVSSNELATLEIIQKAELLLNVPVITSHQALFWAALRKASIGVKPEKLGKLFQI